MASYLIYNELEKKSANGFSYLGGLDPNRQFATHVDNWYFLQLTLMNGNMIDQHLASKELAICDRKLLYWSKNKAFDMKQAERDIANAKRRWNSQDRPRVPGVC